MAPGVLFLVSSSNEARDCRAGVALGSLLLLLFFFFSSALDRLCICVVFSLFGSVSDGSCLSLVPPRPVVVRASQEEQRRKVKVIFEEQKNRNWAREKQRLGGKRKKPSSSSSLTLFPLSFSPSPFSSRRPSSSSPFRLVTRAGWGDPIAWAPATVTRRAPAVPESALADAPLHFLTLDVGKEGAALYTAPGQYLQVRVGDGTDEGSTKPGFFAIASAPAAAAGPKSGASSAVDLLVKATGDPNNAADALCAAAAGKQVEVSPVSGKGFAIDRIPPSDYHTVLLFATGTGISPIRAAIASGLLGGPGGPAAARRRDVRLYYGTRSAAATAFADEEAQWRAAGVRVIPVYSDEGDDYVQDVFARELGAQLTSAEGEKGPVFSATLAEDAPGLAEGGAKTAALLCGHRGMCDAVKALLAAAGVAPEAVLMNF